MCKNLLLNCTVSKGFAQAHNSGLRQDLPFLDVLSQIQRSIKHSNLLQGFQGDAFQNLEPQLMWLVFILKFKPQRSSSHSG